MCEEAIYWEPETAPLPWLTDFIEKKVCYIWLRLVEDGYDLEVEACADDSGDDYPEWLDYELESMGWDFLDGMADKWGFDNDFGRYAQWALENGIAPFQPFRIVVWEPRWYKSSYEYDEWDREVDWEIQKIIPISDWDAARRWEHLMMERRRFIQARDHHRAWLKNQFETRIHNWYIVTDVYGGSYDGWPRGIRYGIRCQFNDNEGRHHWTQLAEGRSDEGDHKEALNKLVACALERYPHVTEEHIRGLRKRWT